MSYRVPVISGSVVDLSVILEKAATAEEIILEYKGLLKSKTKYKDSALRKFKEAYEKLKEN